MVEVFSLKDVVVSIAGQQILSIPDWQVLEGQHWAVLGPNGAGKTTLARALTGRLPLESGTLSVLGEEISRYSATEIGRLIGFASTSFTTKLNAKQSARDVVLAAAHGLSRRFQEEYEEIDFLRADSLLSAFGISHLAQRTFGTLSEGEKQRVQIARAFMADPQALVLDEPGAGLDLGARETLLLALTELANDQRSPAMVVITHHIEQIAAGFTHVLLLNQGQPVAAGPIDEVLTSENLSKVYGFELQVNKVDGRWLAQGKR
ncbi:iron ABC transporter ATP-binding protein [Boudabousia tangfeifanii]|uniref:Iron ABC transporter ATP-binding protein n=1 Tax=Boudabousia tangfeifanii TaxID=1912795 RepID=A0A1D9MKP2_9ACTO|nr:ATP-binding cassette domain-containing protein [Boudabousia tangfeifanii]AOZ72798.1 iron ABC transporter ATP-binding protein [Boudabousia tangfeifanii]